MRAKGPFSLETRGWACVPASGGGKAVHPLSLFLVIIIFTVVAVTSRRRVAGDAEAAAGRRLALEELCLCFVLFFDGRRGVGGGIYVVM